MRQKLNQILHYLNDHPVDRFILQLNTRKLLFLLSIIGIITWQSCYYVFDTQVPAEYRRADATGFNHWWGQEFVYFFYYQNLFPLATTDRAKKFSDQEAYALIKENPKSLRMEWGHWARFGESARIWLYMPYAILKGTAEKPQIIFSNYIFFTLALLLLFAGFWKIKKPLFGYIITAIIGFSPFMVYEIYCNNNVFGLMASHVLILLSIHLPFFNKKPSNKIFITACFTGALIGFMYEIRAESLPILASCIFIYLLNTKAGIFQRIIPPILAILFFLLASKSIQYHFELQFKKTKTVVENVGGTPFIGGKTLVHPFWHPIYCGLGDYDSKYGMVLHDTAVYNFALPILRKQTGLALKYPGKTIYEMGEYYDKDSLYYKKAETIPGFDNIVKERFIALISNDPLWYASILLRRSIDFFAHTSPVGIALNHWVFTIPFTGILAIPLLFVLLYFKKNFWWKLIVFSMPLGASVVLIYSAYNSSYQSVYHFFTLAILGYIVVGLLADVWNVKKQ